MNIEPGKFYFKTVDEASKVLEAMTEIATLHGYVTVSDVRDLCGFQTRYLDAKMGWYPSMLVNIKVCTTVKGEYFLDLPEPIEIRELNAPKRDIQSKLTIMFTEEKKKAYDAGAMAAMDSMIILAQVSGGKIYTQQLHNYRRHMQDLLNERDTNDRRQDGDSQGAQDSEENPATIQLDGGSPSAAGLFVTGAGPVYLATGESMPESSGQAGEGESQAE